MFASRRDRAPASRQGSEPTRALAMGLVLASVIGCTLGFPLGMSVKLAAAADQASAPDSSAEATVDQEARDTTSTSAPAPETKEVKATTSPAEPAPKKAARPRPRPAKAPVNVSTAKSAVPKVSAPAPTTPAGAQVSSPPPAPANAPTVKVAAPPAARTVSGSPRVVAVPPGLKNVRPGSRGPANLAPQDERVSYQYNALGRRDPFQALIGGGFVGSDETGAPPDVGGLKVVGIVWGADDKFALCEDPRGTSMVLRKGDKVMNGVVETLKRDAVVVKLTVDGQTQLVAIPLTRKGDQGQ